MRCFLGFELSPKAKMGVDAWREKALLMQGDYQNVKAANFHLTTWFIGHISSSQLDALVSNIEWLLPKSNLFPFDLTLDDTVYWAKPKIVAVIPSQSPLTLGAAHAFSRKVSEQSGIQAKGNHSEFRPHVTLCRNVNPQSLFSPLMMPNIPVSFTHLHLFESISGKSGVQYLSRFSFALPSGMSVREQLRQGLTR